MNIVFALVPFEEKNSKILYLQLFETEIQMIFKSHFTPHFAAWSPYLAEL